MNKNVIERIKQNIKKNIKIPENEFSSIQINLPILLANKIYKYGEDKISDFKLYDNEIKEYGRQNKNDIHVTVKYGLHTTDKQIVENIIKKFGAIEFILGNISKFKSDDYDVIKIEVISEDLEKLNKLITTKLKCTDKFPIYVPHITVAYVKTDSCNDLIGDDEFKNKKIKKQILMFSAKDGKRYNISLI